MTNKDSYYYSKEEWSRSIGYGEVPPERLKPGSNTASELSDYQKMAQELWFNGGSCTGGKPE
jgi:hypothetical protein